MPWRSPWPTLAVAGVLLAGVALVRTAAPPAGAGESSRAEVVARGIPRPLELAVDGRTLVVLSPGARGDVAGEVYRVEIDGGEPVDASQQPRVKIPFPDARTATLGSLALHPKSRELFLGEENGTRIYRLTADERLTLYLTGLHRLGGGSTLLFDERGQLVVVDHVDPFISPDEERAPPGLEQFREEDYRGPLVFRLALDPAIPLPRRIDRLAPLFPKAWGGRTGGAALPKLISGAIRPGGDLVVLTSSGDLFRLGGEAGLVPVAQLPRAQYTRTHTAVAADGAVFVSGGFQVGTVFRVGPDGAVSVVASQLGDPQGIAVDARGDLYLAESSLHRIVRFRGAARPGP